MKFHQISQSKLRRIQNVVGRFVYFLANKSWLVQNYSMPLWYSGDHQVWSNNKSCLISYFQVNTLEKIQTYILHLQMNILNEFLKFNQFYVILYHNWLNWITTIKNSIFMTNSWYHTDSTFLEKERKMDFLLHHLALFHL